MSYNEFMKRTFICLPVVLTETDGREKEVRNEMCPKRTRGWLEWLIHFSVARQPFPLSWTRRNVPNWEICLHANCLIWFALAQVAGRCDILRSVTSHWHVWIDSADSVSRDGWSINTSIDNGTHIIPIQKQTESFGVPWLSLGVASETKL